MTDEEYSATQMDALLIIMQRNYDLLAVIANAVDPEYADEIVEMHKNGQFFGPPPSYSTQKED